MFKLIVVGIVAVVAQAIHPIRDEIVHDIRAKATTWTAHDVQTNPISNWTEEDIRARLGTVIQPPIEGIPSPAVYNDVIPTSFDSRTKWSNCVHAIRDQAKCGSCWAFGATESLSDRLCIASDGKVDVVLSPQDLVSCDWWDRGCSGGILSWAWSHLESEGAAADTCIPYESQTGKAPSCPSKCKDGSDIKRYQCSDKVQATKIDEIKSDILNNGPMETGFTVYEDFMSYSGGVYKHTSGAQLGGHAVKIVGWGDGYWICANSWGPSWGEKGFFNIAFGECGIDSAVYGCTPKL